MTRILFTWREDLAANSLRRGIVAPILAWFFDPGFACVTLIRIATIPRNNFLRRIVAHWAARALVYRFGCYISVDAKIGRRLVLPHPVGIVIGESSEVGDDVTIYQHVTLGRRNNSVNQYPVICNGAVLYAGAVVLGSVVVGARAAIGANAVVISDVPADSSVGGVPARLLRSRGAVEVDKKMTLPAMSCKSQKTMTSASTTMQ